MLNYFKKISKKRTSWMLLLLSILIFEMAGLFLQHVLHQLPCALCIYIRLSLLGIAFAALIALITPQYIFRYFGILIWLISASFGFYFALQLVKVQYGNAFTTQCLLGVSYPKWLPLNKWMPWMFQAYGDCTNRIFEFLSLGFSEWMVVIFSCYLIFAIIVLLAQFNKKDHHL